MFVLVIGVILLYIFDFLHRRQYAFFTFWGTLVLFWLSFYFSNIYFSRFLILFEYFSNTEVIETQFTESFLLSLYTIIATLFIVLVGVFGTLHFVWFKQLSPKFVVFFEKIIFELFPVVSIPLILQTVVSIAGISNAPFFLVLIHFLMSYWFLRPTESSFLSTKGRVRSYTSRDDDFVQWELVIQDSQFAQIYTFFSLVSPFMFYLFLNFRLILWDVALNQHLGNIFALIAFPLLFYLHDTKKYLWWTKSIDWQDPYFHKMRIVLICALGYYITSFISYRVIFFRYPNLISLPYPLNHLAVLLGLLVIFVALGFLWNDNVGKHGKLLIIMLSTCLGFAASLLFGFPIYLAPIPTGTIYFGISFYFTRKWVQYIIFAIGSTMSMLLWLTKSFSFLSYEFESKMFFFSWSLNLMHTIILLTLFLALTLATVYSVVHITNEKILGVILTIHTIVLAITEHLFVEQYEDFYPTYFAFITTFSGIMLCKHLLQHEKLSSSWASLVLSIYLSKLAVYLGVRMAMISSILATFSLSRIYLAYIYNERISLKHAWSYIIVTGFFLFITKDVIISKLVEIFIDSSKITISRIVGTTILVWGFGILPLSYSNIPNTSTIRKFSLILLIVGGVWSFLEPLLQISSTEMSTIGLFEVKSTYFEFIVPWIFVFVSIIFLGITFRIIPIPQSSIFRLIFFSFMGLGSGISFTGTYLSFCGHTVMTIVNIAFITCAIIIYNSHFPSEKSDTGRSPFVLSIISFIIYLVTFPLSILVSWIVIPRSEEFLTYSEVFEGVVLSIFGVYAAMSFFMAILIKFKLMGRPLLGGKIMAGENAVSVPYSDELASISNISTLLGFSLCIALSIHLQNPPYVYLACAPFLLLLNQDRLLFRGWKDSYRYSLVFAVVEIILAITFMKDLIYAISAQSLESALKTFFNIMLALSSIPALVLVNILISSLKRPNGILVLIAFVPSLISMGLGSFGSVKLIGQVASASCIFLLFTTLIYRPRNSKREL